MACVFEITASGSDEQFVEDVITAALDEVGRLDQMLSAYLPTSELSFVNAEAASRPIIVDPDFFRLLETAKQLWEDTKGAFDPAIGRIIEVWRQAEQTGEMPSGADIDPALATSGMSHVNLDDTINAVSFDIPGIELNLGAIGKGFAVQQAVDVLRKYQIESAFVSSGGSTIFALGNNPEGAAWNVGIRHPSKFDERVEVVSLRNQALSTSGGIVQMDPTVLEKFEHIIDPVTGHTPDTTTASATVIATDATLADALSTAFYLRGKTLVEEYIASHTDVEAILVEKTRFEDRFDIIHYGG